MPSSTFIKLGIIGDPLKHSLSPRLHAHLLFSLGCSGEYQTYEMKAADLPAELNRLAIEGLHGLNVTIPHKVAVMKLLDRISPEAQLAGAVNTIVFEDNGQTRVGHNTDIVGFSHSLPASVAARLPESNILVLGSGGSARAVLMALIQHGAAEITFAVRKPENAVALTGDATLMKEHFGADTLIHVVSLHSLPSLESFAGVINTTPVGLWPQVEESLLSPLQLETLPAGAFVYDLIYRPLQTRLLQDAEELGYQTSNGLDMLLYQGIASLELWLKKPIPADAFASLREEMIRALHAQSA